MSDEVDLGIPGIGPATLVGRGGFGLVYRATQQSSGGLVAVKMLSGHLDDTARLRFEREARALGALRGHPNICTVFDAGVDESDRPYLVMEYAPTTLAQQLADRGAMQSGDAAALGVKLAGALHTAHADGLLHRDVKPENVLITRFGEARLADFGLARFADDTVSRGVTTTVSHAAPELLRGDPPSVATDVYALGSTLFAALTGRLAFVPSQEAHPVSLYRRIEEDPVPEMPDVAEQVAAVVRRAMAKAPEDRYASAREMGEVMRDAQRALGVPVTPLPLALDVSLAPNETAVAETADGATPHAPADADDLTAAVVRADRVAPEVIVHDDDSDADAGTAPRRLDRRVLIGLAGVFALLLVGAAFALSGGGENGGGERAGTTTTSEQTTTTLSEAEQLQRDFPLIRAFWDSYSNAALSSPEALNSFTEQRNHSMMGDISACPETAETWAPFEAILDESGVAREDGWEMSFGENEGRVPTGRIYVTPVQFSNPDDASSASDPIPLHVSIVDDFAYGFFSC